MLLKREFLSTFGAKICPSIITCVWVLQNATLWLWLKNKENSFLSGLLIIYESVDRYPYGDQQLYAPVRNCPQVAEIDLPEHFRYN